MSSVSIMRYFLFSVVLLIAVWGTESRYLPTRSQDDRLERLRDLIKDLLDSEKPFNGLANNDLYERKILFKREVIPAQIKSSSPPFNTKPQ